MTGKSVQVDPEVEQMSLRSTPTGILVILILSPVLAALTQIPVWVSGEATGLNVAILVFFGLTALVFVASLFIHVRFDAGGVSYRSAGGKPKHLAWAEVEEVDPQRRPKMGLALVTADGMRTYSARPNAEQLQQLRAWHRQAGAGVDVEHTTRDI